MKDNASSVVRIAAMAFAAVVASSLLAEGIKAQIAAERKGNKKVFEEALAATEARIWKSANGGTLP